MNNIRLLAPFLLLLAMYGCSSKQADTQSLPEKYTWRNVMIGGGGYITGIKIHPNNADLIYLRTDVGGCYRYDTEQKQLKQLITNVPYEQSNLYGINGLALDPHDQNMVYIAAGKYPDRAHSGVFRSDDKGETWQSMGLNKPFGGNFHPFRTGNPLEVNPHTSELWAGTLGEGLWRYSNNEWHKITSIPDGEYERIAGGNLANGVSGICFDPLDARYVYVAVRGYGLYRSSDGGEVFEKVGEVSTDFYELSLSRGGNELFAAINKGLFRLKNCKVNSTWEDVSVTQEPHHSRTVACSPHANGTLISGDSGQGRINKIYLSCTGGDTWTRIPSTVSNIVKWHPDDYPGSMISQFAFDPKDKEKIYFTDWYSFYKTDNIFAPTVKWSNEMAYGHEEMVPVILLSSKMPNHQGVQLYVGGADLSAIQITDLDNYTTLPNIASLVKPASMPEVSGMDFYEQDPNRVAFSGGNEWSMETGCLALSCDGSKTLHIAEGYLPEWGGGKVAFSGTNPDNLVVATQEGIRYTTDGGKTFHRSQGVSDGSYVRSGIFQYIHPLCGDRVNGDFYLYDNRTGDFSVSTDGGKTFEKRMPLPAGNDEQKLAIIAPHNQCGHLFAALGREGLYTTTNGGEAWTKSTEFASALLIAAGKGITEDAYPAIYLFGKKKNSETCRFYRSTDGGETWLLVNEEARAGNGTQALCADRNVFGRFYVATNGTGVFVAEESDK